MTWIQRAARERDRGASLIEVVVACVLLGILSAAVLTVVLQTQAAGVDNRNRVAAANLAAREIDIVRSEFRRSKTAPLAIANAGTVTNERPLTGGTKGQPLVVDGTEYTVTTSAQWNITGSGESACDGGALVIYPTLGVTVTVTWPNMGSIQPVVNSTSLAPTKGTGIPDSDSFVAVRVTDSKGDLSVGRSVSVTGGGQTKTGTTDAQGCAVVQVSPAAGLGTDYTARATDAGYVDIAGTPNPAKVVGLLSQGQLNNNVAFQIDRAGTANLRLVDEAGAPLPASAAAGISMTLVASEYSGTSNQRGVTATGTTTAVTGLWPTRYGAYFGTAAPAGGFDLHDVGPGAAVTIDITFAAARWRLTDLPAGTATVYAAPVGATTCTGADVRQVDPGAVQLLPGTWSFYVTGPTFDCSPGPSGISLASGDNGEAMWGQTTLRVDNAPPGVLWAVNRSKVSGNLTTCAGAATAASAVNVDAARGAPLALPAGDWFVYATDGAAAGACQGIPFGQYSKVLAYETENVLVWETQPSIVTVKGVPTGSRYSVVASTGATTMDCRYGVPAGSTELRKSNSSATSVTGSFTAGTWNFFQRDTNTGSCTLGGTVVVGSTGAPYSLTLNTRNPGTVR